MNAFAPQKSEPWLEIVRRKAESIRFGVVQVVVHEGRVTQIEVTEKTRLDEPPSSRAATHVRR